MATAEEAAAVVDLAIDACLAYERDDLRPRLAAARARLFAPATRVLVVGEFKQGKSTLVNALVGEPVCPVDDDITTSVPTAVSWAPAPIASAVQASDDGAAPTARPIALDALADLVSESGNPANERRLQCVEVGLPSSLLEPGLVLVDTPGVGGLGSSHAAATIAALPSASAVLLVTGAGQELTAPEMRFLGHARDLSPLVAVVVTKRDVYPSWWQIRDRDRGHLDREGFRSTPLFAVSSPLVTIAREESGIDEVVALLERLTSSGAALQQWAAGFAVHEVARHLEAMLLSQRDALLDPDSAVGGGLEEANKRAERLRAESARWQVTLNDGLADLTADVEHDLRARLRALTAEADERIEAGDPADWWDEYASWLRQRVADEVTATYVLLARRSEELATSVADHFAAAEEEIDLGVDVVPPVAALDALADLRGGIDRDDDGARKRFGRATATGLVAVRGSYSGFAMFGMLGSMLGLAAVNPALVGLTVLMGRRSVREEKARQVAQRRQQARTSSHRHLDEVGFEIGKDVRDAARHTGRALRDGFTSRAEELQRTTAERLERARAAAARTDAERRARMSDVDAELARVRSLAGRAGELLGTVDG